jgi:predicted RNase H-like nuclease (RuvC/YqgF family)
MNHNTALDNTVETMDSAMNVVLQKHEYEYL